MPGLLPSFLHDAGAEDVHPAVPLIFAGAAVLSTWGESRNA